VLYRDVRMSRERRMRGATTSKEKSLAVGQPPTSFTYTSTDAPEALDRN
jgi:hypothetical protein